MYEYFEELLKERGLSVSDVSRETGIPKSSLSEWKSGKYRLPKPDRLRVLADFFDVPVEFFMTGERKPRTYGDPLIKEVQRLASDDVYRELVVTINAATEEQRARILSYARFLASEGKL